MFISIYLFVTYTICDGCLWLTWKTLDSSSSPVWVSTVGSSGRACLAWCAAADSARVCGDSLLPSTETVRGNDPEISESAQTPSHSTIKCASSKVNPRGLKGAFTAITSYSKFGSLNIYFGVQKYVSSWVPVGDVTFSSGVSGDLVVLVTARSASFSPNINSLPPEVGDWNQYNVPRLKAIQVCSSMFNQREHTLGIINMKEILTPQA